jgi:hypothetical protein
MNFTGNYVALESDGSCGDCFTGKVTIPDLGINVGHPTFTVVLEGCQGNCTGMLTMICCKISMTFFLTLCH